MSLSFTEKLQKDLFLSVFSVKSVSKDETMRT
jgi:hypothetical protein